MIPTTAIISHVHCPGPTRNCIRYKQVAISDDGKFLAAITDLPDFILSVWDVTLRRVIATSSERFPILHGMSFNPSNSTEFAVCIPGQVMIFTIETCRHLLALGLK